MGLEVRYINLTFGQSCWRTALFAVAIFVGPLTLHADEAFPVLEAGSETYSNVTVTSKTGRYIIVSHAKGMTSIKLKDLSPDILKQLGYAVEEPKPKPLSKTALQQKLQLDPRIKEVAEQKIQEITERIQQLDPKIIQMVLAGLGLGYLFFCYCSMLICKKAGQEPGVLVWLPVIQTFPLLKAAGMSAWFFLLLLVPLTTLPVIVGWCVKICRARGKSSWLAIFLLLPISSLFTFLYLAFADPLAQKEPAQQKITFN